MHYSQQAVKAAFRRSTGIGEGGLGCGVVLLVESEDDLVTDIGELEGGCGPQYCDGCKWDRNIRQLQARKWWPQWSHRR